MNKKICKTCKIEKLIDEFPFQDKKKGIYRTQCKECYAKSRKEKRESNIEIEQQKARDSYEKHKETRIKKVREYQKNNPEKVKE